MQKTDRTNYVEPLTNKVGEIGKTKLKEKNIKQSIIILAKQTNLHKTT